LLSNEIYFRGVDMHKILPAKPWIPVTLSFLFSSFIYSQNVNVTDYQVPISKAQTLRFDGSWNWSQAGDDVTSNNANGNLLYRTFYSSLPLAWFINLDATGNKNFKQTNFIISVDASFRKYIWDYRDVFGFARITGEAAKGYDQVASDLTVGFGYGRYINATALAKAVRIEDHLLSDKVISDYLPKETMINIANIIEREDEYKVKYGTTYETQWFNDIEEEINKSGMLEGENVGSIGILRMRQVLFNINERVNQRYYGWDFTLGFLFPLTTPYDTIPTGTPNLTIGGRYSYPINWQMQINNTAEVFTPIDSAFFKQFRTRFIIDFIYELSNRINFITSYNLVLFKPENASTVLNHTLTASFWYYIENNIYLTISADFIKQGDNPKVLGTRVGLQYNLF